MSRPRALMIASSFPPERGGMEVLAERIAEEFKETDVRVVTHGYRPSASYDAGRTLSVRRTRRAPGDRHSLKLLAAAAIAEAFRFGPDVVLSMHVSVAPAALVLQRAGIPFLQYAHAKEFGHHRRLCRLAFPRADAVVAVSRYTEGLVCEFGAPAERVHRILNGADPPLLSELRSPGSRPTIISVSRLDDAYKGHDVIIRAFPTILDRVPDARWVVLGDGAIRQQIDIEARRYPPGTVEVLGFVSDIERSRWLSRAHVFVLPSRVPPDRAGGEGFGIAYLEASAHGLPVVAGNEGGTVDAVIDGETGILVNPTDVTAVAGWIVHLLTHPDEADRLGRAGQLRAAGLSWAATAGQVEAVLSKLVRRRDAERRGG